ncbi:MAG: sugar ABC transporter ATP-binding protein [Pirellulales bacterium]
MPPTLLSMQAIHKRFGATLALRGVSLEVRAGEVLALIGENGAGKSTLMKILSGAHPPDMGRMELAGQPYAPRGPHAARLAGVAMIYQELSLAADLSVEDNIMLGQETHRLGWLRRGEQRRRVRDALALLGHAELRPETPVRRLSVGAQQLVEIARALAFDAKVLVFDEPTSSLAGRDVEHLFEVIRRLRDSGRGIVYISHYLEEVRRICDSYSVLRDGETAGSGRVADVTDKQIVALMVGRNVADLFPQVPHQPGEPLLSLAGLSGNKKPSDVSLELRRGEILGLAGLVGAGRTELLRCIFGLDRVRGGQVRVAHLRWSRTRGAMQAGLGLLSEDRKGEGLAQQRSIADNITLSRLRPYSRLGFLNLARRKSNVAHWMQRLEIKAKSAELPVLALSGGNQQKVALARLLHQQADVLLLDEPTRGIDVATKATIYRLIGELAAQGKAILFVSSYLPELLAMCDRLGVMARGRLREIRPVQDWTEHTVLEAAIAAEETS